MRVVTEELPERSEGWGMVAYPNVVRVGSGVADRGMALCAMTAGAKLDNHKEYGPTLSC